MESSDAIIFITSVKPVLDSSITSMFSSLEKRLCLNAGQCKQFVHFLPFTKDNSNKAHAKCMDQQWKYRIIFSVAEPFPYVSIRQEVSSKTVQELSPIEVAIDDIHDRIQAMEEELANSNLNETNNLMRLISGSVLPQVSGIFVAFPRLPNLGFAKVNAGATEVARVFLPRVDCGAEYSLQGCYPASFLDTLVYKSHSNRLTNADFISTRNAQTLKVRMDAVTCGQCADPH